MKIKFQIFSGKVWNFHDEGRKMKDYKYVKQIFKQYEGSYFHMIRDGVYEEYKSYQVPREVELKWNYNKQEELKKILLETQNNKVIVDIFQKYRNYAAHLNDEKALEFMLEYVCEHMVNWDSSTVLKNVNVILNSIDFLKTRNKKGKLLRNVFKSYKKF